MTTTMKYMR